MNIKELFGFEGKNVVVTGAASGMGRAAADFLVELGARVHAVDLNPIDLSAGKTYQYNLADKESLDLLVSELPSDIVAVFSCHGIAHIPGRDGVFVTKVNFISHQYLTEQLLPKLTDRASITYISSVAGLGWEQSYGHFLELIAQPTWDSRMQWLENHRVLVGEDGGEYTGKGYDFSKQCLLAYVNSKAQDPMFTAKQIRLNAICPGSTKTGLTHEFNLTAGKGDADAGNKFTEQLFLSSWNGYMAEPKDMAYPLVALGSNLCSYVSGQKLYVDYGITALWSHYGLASK